jgi:arylsulfatase A-like enzyme
MSNKPNIVFMIADDHRFSAIRALANQYVQTPDFLQTPNFDKLAKGGTSFLNTHIMGGWHKAVCAPSRACVHTGGSVFNAVPHEPEPRFDNTMKNHCAINPSMSVMPEVLKGEGYHTYAIGKWHNDRQTFNKSFSGGDALFFGGMADPEQIPLHHFNPEGAYPPGDAVVTEKHATERFCDAGVQFIEEYDNESPFFMYMAFTSPHDPRRAPQKYADLYDPKHIPLPKNFMPVHPFDNGEMHVRDEGLARLPRDPREISEHIADYYAMISHMDAQIGRVLEALQEQGLEEDTIVVYTSDHGLALGQHGLIGKQNVYDHSIRIPFLLRGPAVPKDTRIDSLTCQMDIFPTLCELTGTSIPKSVDGTSLVPLLDGRRDELYESVFSIYKDVQRTVTKDHWKLIRYDRSEETDTGSCATQLFNLEEDPWETDNLALKPGYGPRLEELLQEMEEWQVRADAPELANLVT